MGGHALVVVPAYNEAASIGEVASRAARYAPVLVVDDGSRDRTAEIAASVPGCTVLRHDTNQRIAAGIRDGFAYALSHGYAHAVTMDAGLSHDPDALPRLLDHGPADLVLTYRVERVGVPPYRRVLTAAARVAVNAAIGAPGAARRARYRDVTSGYRRYSRRAMETVLATEPCGRSFDFHFEALAVVHHAGLTIAEVPITYRFTNSSLSRRAFVQAVATWWKLVRGLHRPSPQRSVLC